MVHTENINAFLTEYLTKENIGFSHPLDQILPNHVVRNCCMCDNAKIVSAKDHLKQGTFR